MSGIIDSVGSKSGIVGSDVYPQGHVLQTTSNKYAGAASAALSSATLTIVEAASNSKHWNGVINNVLASSSVFITCTFQWQASTTSADVGAGFGFFRLVGSTETQIFPTTGEDSGLSYANYTVPRSSGSGTKFLNSQSTMSFVDTSAGTGTNTYYLAYSCPNGAVLINQQSPFQMILQEIAG